MLRKLNRILKAMTVILIAALALSQVTGCSKNRGNKVVIKGSTTVLPITQKAAEEYHKISSTGITIEGSGSGNGIKSLLDGNCDIANSSREMKEEEIKLASSKNIRVKEIAVAYDMIVPVLHPSNPVSNLSLDQLKAIYDGSITDWKQVGGKPGRVVVISRDTSSGTYEIWEKIVMKKADVRRDALLQASNGAIVSVISENPLAIGYIGYGYINETVKPCKVNSVDGTIENGKSGQFPISRKLYMYVDENRLSAEAKNFIDFLLAKEGQKLVKETGFIPL